MAIDILTAGRRGGKTTLIIDNVRDGDVVIVPSKRMVGPMRAALAATYGDNVPDVWIIPFDSLRAANLFGIRARRVWIDNLDMILRTFFGLTGSRIVATLNVGDGVRVMPIGEWEASNEGG